MHDKNAMDGLRKSLWEASGKDWKGSAVCGEVCWKAWPVKVCAKVSGKSIGRSVGRSARGSMDVLVVEVCVKVCNKVRRELGAAGRNASATKCAPRRNH